MVMEFPIITLTYLQYCFQTVPSLSSQLHIREGSFPVFPISQYRRRRRDVLYPSVPSSRLLCTVVHMVPPPLSSSSFLGCVDRN
jgi:hypothetical protein